MNIKVAAFTVSEKSINTVDYPTPSKLLMMGKKINSNGIVTFLAQEL